MAKELKALLEKFLGEHGGVDEASKAVYRDVGIEVGLLVEEQPIPSGADARMDGAPPCSSPMSGAAGGGNCDGSAEPAEPAEPPRRRRRRNNPASANVTTPSRATSRIRTLPLKDIPFHKQDDKAVLASQYNTVLFGSGGCTSDWKPPLAVSPHLADVASANKRMMKGESSVEPTKLEKIRGSLQYVGQSYMQALACGCNVAAGTVLSYIEMEVKELIRHHHVATHGNDIIIGGLRQWFSWLSDRNITPSDTQWTDVLRRTLVKYLRKRMNATAADDAADAAAYVAANGDERQLPELGNVLVRGEKMARIFSQVSCQIKMPVLYILDEGPRDTYKNTPCYYHSIRHHLGTAYTLDQFRDRIRGSSFVRATIDVSKWNKATQGKIDIDVFKDKWWTKWWSLDGDSFVIEMVNPATNETFLFHCRIRNGDALENIQPFNGAGIAMDECNRMGHLIMVKDVWYQSRGMFRALSGGEDVENVPGRFVCTLMIAPRHDAEGFVSTSQPGGIVVAPDAGTARADLDCAVEVTILLLRLGFMVLTPQYLLGESEQDIEAFYEAQGQAYLAGKARLGRSSFTVSDPNDEEAVKADCEHLVETWNATMRGDKELLRSVLPGGASSSNLENWYQKGFMIWLSSYYGTEPVRFKYEWFRALEYPWWLTDGKRLPLQGVDGATAVLQALKVTTLMWGPPWTIDKLSDMGATSRGGDGGGSVQQAAEEQPAE